MFLNFYHLREQPFGVTPDPRYLYLSRTHREALASLFYGVEMGRGFLALIAPPGMGKTTVLFRLLERLRKSTYTAFLFQTQCDSREFIRFLLADMGIDSHGHDLVHMQEALNEALIRLKRADRRFVLVIDEAQNFEDSVLETVRLLSNFETPGSKLMQIIISGQPQLAAKLTRPSLAQFRQRVAILSRLEPFGPAETDRYIDDRLQVAGYGGGPLFTSDARAIIAERSGGIPRNINNLCFNALSLGYALRRMKIDGEIVREVVKDLDLESLVREGDDTPRIVSPGPPTEPPSSFGTKRRGALGLRTFHIAALAASLVLASLFLFPSVRRLLGTRLDRGFSGSVVPLAKSLGLSRPMLPPTVSTTAPPDRSAVADGAANDTGPPGTPRVVIEVKPGQTLEQIIVGYFGQCDMKLFRQIRALNPQITDADDIESGQRIVLPRRTQALPGTDSVDLANIGPMTSVRN